MIVKIIDSNYPSCAKVKISDPQVIEWAEAKVHVFSYSVLCFGKVPEPAETVERWKGQLHDCHKDVSEQFYGIDGERIEFRVEHFPRTYVIGTASKDSGVFGKHRHSPRKICVSNYLLVNVQRHHLGQENNDQECISNSEAVRNYAKKFLPAHWTFIGLGSEDRWYDFGVKTRRKVEFCGRTDATTICGDRTPCFYRYQFSESWSCQEKEQQKHHSH